MAHLDFSFRRVLRGLVILVLAAGFAALAGALIGDRLIPALLQLGVGA